MRKSLKYWVNISNAFKKKTKKFKTINGFTSIKRDIKNGFLNSELLIKLI